MKAAIYSQKKDLDTFLYLNKFISELALRDVSVVLHAEMAERLNFSKEFETFSCKEELKDKNVNIVFSFGGDGTILNALTFIQDLEIPIIGVNTGRLGFLANFRKDQIFDELDSIILEKNYNISERSVIKISTNRENNIDFPFALNDVSLSRKETTSMITVESYINDDFLNVFWGDGLIVSTPTGSTAYSLSCGGPIISPANDNFVITPIAPHNLNVRPLIVKDDAKIRLIVESRVEEYTLALDSRLYHMEIGSEITIEKADFSLFLIKPKKFSFYETIRQKLLWGNDKRN
ncbi:NAD kinase [Epilithonimonas ginsengisoli]|uniref:NAD kinase n=1 Tax=Epilithonimonas ginsengisoli TaxID=1245592 RepID=A0ABU4JED8_9FLAO|nr:MULTISPECIES: NAD kinase [Chryseobacterium group]MBV6879291.1 NAD kinase [Epilithonimonas sp. FP105]MDW8548012.1 NAD kinase [Epilithonimonas ginsengisoli]OAH73069.1 NAD(+) kinase [Chryseobacterium sp. FP211-J200]